MKPQLLKVSIQPEHSFNIRKDEVPYFFNHLHYHPELELTLIRKGTGTRFVGDHIENFSEGDLILVGSNLPHMWRSDEVYFEGKKGLLSESTVVHFMDQFWGKSFLEMPEMKSIRELLYRAQRGIRINGNTRDQVSAKMQKLFDLNGFERVITLLQILHLIAVSKDTSLLSGIRFSFSYDEMDAERINQVYSFTLTHFQREIPLLEIAKVANVSPNSFCRYFKSKTRKTFSRFLQEIRIGHACKLLSQTDMSINQICYASGFNNLSNFNRYFKEIMQMTPREYVRQLAIDN